MTRIPRNAVPLAEWSRRQAWKVVDEIRPDYAGMLAKQCEAEGHIVRRDVLYAEPRKLRADLLVMQARGRELKKVLVEIQGGIFTRQAHGSITGILADNDRLNEAIIHGWRMLRVTPDMILKDGKPNGEALALVKRALG